MADKIYNPPATESRCPQCDLQLVPHGAGAATDAGTTWRYACPNARKAPARRTCSYSFSEVIAPRPSIKTGLAEELRAMAKGSPEKTTLRLVADLIVGDIPEGLAKALPPGEISEELKDQLFELSNHACAGGLLQEMILLRALSKGFGSATAAVIRGFRSA